MANRSKSIMQIVGIALVVLGVGLGVWGYQLSGSLGSQVTVAVTGSDTDEVMTLYIAAAVSLVVGIFIFIKK